jgi:hypothetical protein
MYLPAELPDARVLVTVKAYPKPSGRYEELVCTAGLLDGSKWIRIYPVPYRFLAENQMYPKYSWVKVNLVRNSRDFRPESYRRRNGLDEEFVVETTLGTEDAWAARKAHVFSEVFVSMNELIAMARGDEKKSLATPRPSQITGFKVQRSNREWKEEWTNQALQSSFLEYAASQEPEKRRLVQKVPYDYYYEFLSEGDKSPRKLKIEDWEIGALYWHCLSQTQGDEVAANQLIRQKYFDTFRSYNDIYFFLGTTKRYHNVAPNPFIIVGVFYPPRSLQEALF